MLVRQHEQSEIKIFLLAFYRPGGARRAGKGTSDDEPARRAGRGAGAKRPTGAVG